MSPPTDEQVRVRAFCDMLLSLYNSHRDWVTGSRESRGDKRQQLNREATERFEIINVSKLRSLAELTVRRNERLDFAPREFLFLKPPRGGIVLPALNLSSDLGKSELRIQMVLFTYDGARLVAIGYRFETPEQ